MGEPDAQLPLDIITFCFPHLPFKLSEGDPFLTDLKKGRGSQFEPIREIVF